MSLRLVPYHETYNDSICELEQAVMQGKSIRLQIVKDHFFSRTTVFEKYHTCLVVDEKKVVGTAMGAETVLVVNGNHCRSGVGYDVKVHPGYRKRGIGKMMARHFYQTFFKQEGLTHNFITLKRSNNPVIRLVSAVHKIWLYDFVYLTLPSRSRVQPVAEATGNEPLLSVTLFDAKELDPSYYTVLPGGMAYFHTYKMYRLVIRGVHPLVKWGIRLLKKLQPKRYAYVPQEGDLLQFACLFNHHPGNISGINSVLEALEKEGIGYLLVCCRKRDAVYRALQKYSINTYGYYILTDFPVKRKDSVMMDVRCL